MPVVHDVTRRRAVPLALLAAALLALVVAAPAPATPLVAAPSTTGGRTLWTFAAIGSSITPPQEYRAVGLAPHDRIAGLGIGADGLPQAFGFDGKSLQLYTLSFQFGGT